MLQRPCVGTHIPSPESHAARVPSASGCDSSVTPYRLTWGNRTSSCYGGKGDYIDIPCPCLLPVPHGSARPGSDGRRVSSPFQTGGRNVRPRGPPRHSETGSGQSDPCWSAIRSSDGRASNWSKEYPTTRSETT